MEFFGEARKKIRNISLSAVSIVVIALLSIWYQTNTSPWKSGKIIQWDVLSYYGYLPAKFIYKDISLEFIYKDRDKFSQWYWPSVSPKKKLILKTTMGMSVLYSPFFFVAHFLAEPLGYEANGYTLPYHFAISMAGLIFLILGLIIIRRLLLSYFNETTTAITLILIVFSTNLFWYSTREAGMTHVYSFALFAGFVLCLNHWLRKATILNSILFGMLCGLIALIRPTNALIGILFVLWGVSTFKQFGERFKLLLERRNYLALMILSAIVVWIPQMLYWKQQAGLFFYNAYDQEGFFFDSPKIVEGLFSYRKGWLLYTPIMVAAFAGLITLRKYAKGQSFAIAAFMAINIYIIFSWWCWWYGGSYGGRPMIESYAIMAFPLAALVQYALDSERLKKIAILATFTVLLSHGVFQHFQYHYGAIHWDSMTKESYWDSFFRLKPSKDYWNKLQRPNYNAALKGEDN